MSTPHAGTPFEVGVEMIHDNRSVSVGSAQVLAGSRRL